MTRPLAGQNAIVTGASSGIGRGVAKAVAAAGASVAVNYRSGHDEAAEVVREIESDGGSAYAVRADVADEDDVKAMFAEALERLGPIDILVNNAGIQSDAAFTEMSLDDWRKVIDVNLTGQFLCAREAVRAFVRQGVREGVSVAAGKVVCMSSVHEIIPWACRANYAASKGGVSLLMQSLAQEMSGAKIRVNSVAPGAIKTAINREAWQDEAALKELLRLIPYGRVGEVEDVAKAVVWLASDESDYVVGSTLVIDGGMALYPSFHGGG